MKAGAWLLYILECADGSFYTGVTNDLDRRLRAHRAGAASRYTRIRRPVKLLYCEPCGDRAGALSRECAVKSLSRRLKEELVRGERRGERQKKSARADVEIRKKSGIAKRKRRS